MFSRLYPLATPFVRVAHRRFYRAANTTAKKQSKELRNTFRKFLLASHPDILRGIDEERATYNEHSLQTLNAIVDAALGQDGQHSDGTKIAQGKYSLQFWCIERNSDGGNKMHRVTVAAKVPHEDRLRLPFAVKAVKALAEKAGVEIGGAKGRESTAGVETETEPQPNTQSYPRRSRRQGVDERSDDIVAVLRRGMYRGGFGASALTEAALFEAVRNHQQKELEREAASDPEEQLSQSLRRRCRELGVD